jgi:hypothetical protein
MRLSITLFYDFLTGFVMVPTGNVCATLTSILQTHTVVTALTAFTLLYTRSAGVTYFCAGAVACTVSVKGIKRILRHARPVQTTHRQQKQTFGYVAGADTLMHSYQPRDRLGCPARIPQLSLFMEHTSLSHVHGCRCTQHFLKALCFAPSLRWSLSRGHVRLPVPGFCWGITLRCK